MPPLALSEHHSKHLLALYGIATPQEEIVTTAAEAAEAAQRIGFPVVAKIASAEIAHKTDVGGVRLNLRTAADVRSATEDVIASVASRQPGARVDGVSIQAMIPSGVELVLGIQQDEQFGPLIVAGIGGVLVELLCDVATRIAPVSTDGAHAMLNSLRGFPILAGYRGNARRLTRRGDDGVGDGHPSSVGEGLHDPCGSNYRSLAPDSTPVRPRFEAQTTPGAGASRPPRPHRPGRMPGTRPERLPSGATGTTSRAGAPVRPSFGLETCGKRRACCQQAKFLHP